MDIKRKPNEYYRELGSYTFTEDQTSLAIYMSEDKSLNFTITTCELMAACDELNEFIITKENYEVYLIFKELIDDFEKLAPVYDLSKELLKNFDDYKNIQPYSSNNKPYNKTLYFSPYEEPDLYKDRCITWHSDSSYFYMMNTLRIKETPRGIKISIKTSSKTDLYLGRNVKIYNSYSHQNPFSFLFMSFYYKLQSIDPNYHQQSIFEYL